MVPVVNWGLFWAYALSPVAGTLLAVALYETCRRVVRGRHRGRLYAHRSYR